MNQPKPLWQLAYKYPVNLADYLSRPKEELHDPFLWQKEFEEIVSDRLTSLTASTGAGKSFAAKIAALNWVKTPCRKAIIVVPQLQIGQEFLSGNIKLSDGSIEYFTSQNLCGKTTDGTINQLLDFISNKNPELTPELRIMVCCAPTIAKAFQRNPKKKIWSGIKLIIDEAHHVSTGEDTRGNMNPNGLGEVFLSVLKNPTNSTLLVTATHFRTDELSIIPQEYIKSFRHFEVPFYRVQEECRFWNKQISFEYAVYKTNFWDALKVSFNPNLKTIIFLHPKISVSGATFKANQVRLALESLGEIVREDRENGCVIVKNGQKELIVADLVTQKRQNNARAFITKVSKEEKTFRVDVILALNMFKEGSDYPPLQHCIIHDIRNSYGDIIQMSGRVTRDYTEKTYCKVTMLLPNDLSITDDDAAEKLNNHLKLIVGSMSLSNYFKPMFLRVKKERVKTDNSDRTSYNPLSILGDEIKQNEFKTDAIKRFTSLTLDNPEAKNSYEVRLGLMNQAVREVGGVPDGMVAEIAEDILTECALMIKARDGVVELDEIDHEFLKRVDTSDFIYQFVTDLMGPVDMKLYRDKIVYMMGIKTNDEFMYNCWKIWITAKKKGLIAELPEGVTEEKMINWVHRAKAEGKKEGYIKE